MTQIDKSFIGSFLLNFFESSQNPKIQSELLNTLSSLLAFTEDQQAKVDIGEGRLVSSSRSSRS